MSIVNRFQLWVNLAAADKMDEPRYRDIPAAQLAALEGPGYKAVAIAGDWHVSGQRARGPLVELESRAAIMDLSIEPGGEVVLATPEHESVMAYIYKGGLAANEEAGAQSLVITGPGEQWRLRADSAGMDALILRGQPLREPVAHYGPFVMNTAAEIERAIQDYQTGQFA